MNTARSSKFLAAAAILLLGIYLIALYQAQLGSTEASLLCNWKIDPEEIQAVAIQYPEQNGQTLGFSKDSGSWKLTEPAGFPYTQALADGLPLSLAYIQADKLIEDGKELKWSEFGLDHPIEINVKMNDGKNYELLFGKTTSTKDAYYFTTGERRGVYTMTLEKADAVLLTLEKLRDKNVLGLNREQRPKQIAQEIKQIVLQKHGSTILSAKRDDGLQWLPEVAAERADEIATALSRVMAKEFVDQGALRLKDYGLDPPLYSIEFENKQGAKKLLIGTEKIKAEEFYAYVEGSGEIFVLSQKGFDFIKN